MRQIPWFQEAARRNPHTVEHLTDCERCMRERPAMIRRSMACGFEPKTPDGVAWRFGEFARDAPEASTCIGYLRLLPEVDEIARAWLHWSKGQIVVALGGEMPNPKLRAGVEIFDAAINAVSAWRMTPREEGGGR